MHQTLSERRHTKAGFCNGHQSDKVTHPAGSCASPPSAVPRAAVAAWRTLRVLGSGARKALGWPVCPEACSGTSGLHSSFFRDACCLVRGREVPVLAVGRSALRPAIA